ncbi:MAG: hypothetical protein KJO44_03630 [Gemmatimonadetes bacterium]|nr:hypothetical protein [Gemmatimonadota bacterium]
MFAIALTAGMLLLPRAPAEAGPSGNSLRSALPTLPAECKACLECFGENYFKGTGTPCQVCHGYKDTRGDCGQGWCDECNPEEEQEDAEQVDQIVLGLASTDAGERMKTLRASAERLVMNGDHGTVLVLGGCSGSAIVAEIPMGGADGLAGTLMASGLSLTQFDDLIPAAVDGTPSNPFGAMPDVLDAWADLN